LVAKRVLDVAGAGAALLASAPVMAAVAIAIRASDGSPILFRQARPGRHRKPFTLLKFRTMRGSAPEVVDAELDAQRISPLGRFLRATSLDELPQLVNVLRGEMSLVGPRPLVTQYLSRYSIEQARRHEVLPGITGWAQVNGRNSLTWERRFQLDVWYVNHWSPWLDVKILGRTLIRVLRREGISGEGHVTMPEFMGSAKNGSTAR